MLENSYEQSLDKPIDRETLDGLSTDESRALLEFYIQRQEAYLAETPITGFRRYQREIYLMDAQLQCRLLDRAAG